MLDGLICVYRSNVDFFFYVMGFFNENEVRVINNGFKGFLLYKQRSENIESKFVMEFVFFIVDFCKCFKCILRCNQLNVEEKCGKESIDG